MRIQRRERKWKRIGWNVCCFALSLLAVTCWFLWLYPNNHDSSQLLLIQVEKLQQLQQQGTSLQQADPPDDTTTATVIGLAAGYDLPILERFVGSLRKTGYRGHIILGVAPNVTPAVLHYLKYRAVMVHQLEWIPCDYPYKVTVCAAPYANLKVRWGRYPLSRDWLQVCTTCTGPVLVTDVRDVIFQRDPFQDTNVTGLQLFAEHPYQTTLHKLVKKPIKKCKNIKMEQPMLCSGTIVGTRQAMLDYLQVMHTELNEWSATENCRMINKVGGDQAVHNYVYYSGKLPNAQVISFQSSTGAIVATVAVWAKLLEYQIRNATGMVKGGGGAVVVAWEQMSKWNVTDAEGFFIEKDGSRSRVVHQFDRFKWAGYDDWLRQHRLDRDPVPPIF